MPEHPIFPPRDEIRKIVAAALAEDLGRGDATSSAFIDPAKRAKAAYISRQRFILCGGPLLSIAFEIHDPEVKLQVNFPDGRQVEPGTVLAEAEGPVSSLLAVERVSLNFLQRLSGIATTTNRYVEAIKGTKVKILDTRKTTPGLRVLEKYAVRVGGAHNHRAGLDDGILVKENHIAAAGGLDRIIQKLSCVNRGLLQIEVEVQTLQQLRALIGQPVDVVMLDNMSPAEAAAAVRLVSGRLKLEASGGITLDNIRQYAEAGVDFISVGALTHSYLSSDISFLLQN